MTPIEELVDGAAGDLPLSTLLRKLRVVAARIGVPELDEWVAGETDGYGSDVLLPDYRGPIRTGAHANLSGPFGSELRNIALPKLHFPAQLPLDDLFSVEIRQGVAELEDLVSSGQDTFQVPWDPNYVSMMNTLIQRGDLTLVEDHGITSAWRPVPKSLVVRVLDRVRTKILDLSLRLESEFPEAGAADNMPDSSERQELGATVSATIYGDNNIVTVAGRDAALSDVALNPLDRAALVAHLEGLNLPDPEIRALEAAIEADGDIERDSPGPEVSKWLSRANAAGSAIAANAAGSAVVSAVFAYLGVG